MNLRKKAARKSGFSVRFSPQMIERIQCLAGERHTSSGATIRDIVQCYFNEQEEVGAIYRVESHILTYIDKLSKRNTVLEHKLNEAMLEVDYIRIILNSHFMKKLSPNESIEETLRRGESGFLKWFKNNYDGRLDLFKNTYYEILKIRKEKAADDALEDEEEEDD